METMDSFTGMIVMFSVAFTKVDAEANDEVALHEEVLRLYPHAT